MAASGFFVSAVTHFDKSEVAFPPVSALQSLSLLFQPATRSNLPPEVQVRRAPNGHTSQTPRQRKENQVGPLLSGRGQTPGFQPRSVLADPTPSALETASFA